jgi:hypothetical protein
LELDTFEQEVIPPLLKCEGEEARHIEWKLWKHVANQELLGDDHPIKEHYPVLWRTWFKLFGLETEVVRATTGNVGHQFVHQIESLEDDYGKLGSSEYGVDREATLKELSQADGLFGDILPARLEMGCLYAVPTQKIVHFMGMENMYVSMFDSPEIFKEMMDRIRADYIAYFKWMENESLLLPTTGAQSLGQGTFCYTEELPSKLPEGRPLSTNEVWGYLDSQETVGISPSAYGEYIFGCYKGIAEIFGLLSYGCCEPVHSIWDQYISRFPNLRKVSISAWCDEEFMGERLRGKKVIYQRKPSPNFLGVGDILDEDAVRAHIKKTVEAASGCRLEISQRDVYTIGNSLDKARRYLALVRETIDRHWKG